eukprot:260060_1
MVSSKRCIFSIAASSVSMAFLLVFYHWAYSDIFDIQSFDAVFPIPTSSYNYTHTSIWSPNTTTNQFRHPYAFLNTSNAQDRLLNSIIETRTKVPIRCDNSTHNVIETNPIDHNWALFYLRCKFRLRKHPTRHLKVPFGEGIVTKSVFYTHVFKGGGSTIQVGLSKLCDDHVLGNCSAYQNRYIHLGGGNTSVPVSVLLDYLQNTTIKFTFVRDPIDRFLSGFYEVNKRIVEDEEPLKPKTVSELDFEQMNGIELMRAWVDFMVNGKRIKYAYIDFHTRPNIQFLQQSIEHNFIGDLYNLKQDLPQVLHSNIVDEKVKENDALLMEYFDTKRNRHSASYTNNRTNRFSVDRSELSDADIKTLCEIYWQDYMCLPFDIPTQCDIVQIFRQHYGRDVTYADCV